MAFTFDELLFSPLTELKSRAQNHESFDEKLLAEFSLAKQREKLYPLEAERLHWIIEQLLVSDNPIKLADLFYESK